ncbi:hypothetical protein PGT21_011379 [Puccinia graminis f. sp. tritici]|uniref:Uncharacterized protein n=1 Tax=Puccinia graminis f. sp. tritici TaxID=56615 RepID=A0A5B0MND1_PUCGR|nr:hypothetical protein PGT21_011379 [Puccinia graminis f. sp. tritici]
MLISFLIFHTVSGLNYQFLSHVGTDVASAFPAVAAFGLVVVVAREWRSRKTTAVASQRCDSQMTVVPRTLSTKAIQARPNSQAKLLRLPSLRNRRASQHCTAAVIGIISPKSHPCTLVPQKMFDNRSSSRFSFRLDTRIPEKEALNMKFF